MEYDELEAQRLYETIRKRSQIESDCDYYVGKINSEIGGLQTRYDNSVNIRNRLLEEIERDATMCSYDIDSKASEINSNELPSLVRSELDRVRQTIIGNNFFIAELKSYANDLTNKEN